MPGAAAEPVELREVTMSGGWLLPRRANELRWLIVHDSQPDGILHIEVLARAPRSKPWKFKHLADHMAITEQALRASVVGLGGYGVPYPESYGVAMVRWRALDAEGKAPVCVTSVLECLESVR